MSYAKFLALLITVLGFFLIGNANRVIAQDSACIAIYPCLEDGSIDPRFDLVGYCGDKWRAQCSQVRADLLSQKFNSCQEENVALSEQRDALIAEQSKLQKTLRKLRRAKLKN